MLVPRIKDNDWTSVRQAISKLASSALGPTSSPTFAGLTLNRLSVDHVEEKTPGHNVVFDNILSTAVGTVAAPSYTFTGFEDTGMYYIHPNKIGFSTGGSLALRLDSYGVMIIDGVANAPSYSFFNDDDSGFYLIGADNIGLTLNGVKRVDFAVAGTTITGNLITTGNAGIGTASPDSVLHIKASVPGIVGDDYAGQLIIQSPTNDVNTSVVITGYKSDVSGDPDVQLWYLGSSSSGNEDIIFLNRRNAKLALGTNNTHRLTILGNGNVGINTTTPLSKLSINGGLHVGGDSDAGDNNLLVDGTASVDSLVAGTVSIIPVSNEFKFLNAGNNLGLQAMDSAMILRVYSELGNRTQNVNVNLYGYGSPASNTNRERLNTGWNAAAQEFQINVNIGGDGVAKELVIFTHGKTNQLRLATSGAVYLEAGALILPTDTAQIHLGAVQTTMIFKTDGTNGIIDVATALRLGNTATNYTEISNTGVQTMVGTARVVRSIDLEPTLATRPATGAPDVGVEPANGFVTHDFDDTNDESVFFHLELPHNYADAGTIHIHFDFFVDVAEAGATSVSWGVEYKKLSIGDIFSFTIGSETKDYAVPTAVTPGTPANNKKTHQSAEVNLTTTGFVAGDYVLLRLFRDASGTGGTDSFPRDARVIDYHIEYLSDKLGEAT